MKKLIVALVVIAMLAPPSVVTAETLAESVQRAARALASAQGPAPARTRMNNSGMYVGGLVLSGAGGFLLGRGIATKRETLCYGSGGATYCEEFGSNKNALIFGGAAMAGAGIWLASVGGRRVSVSPSLNGVAVRFNMLD